MGASRMYALFFLTLKQQQMSRRVMREVKMAVPGMEIPRARANVEEQSQEDLWQ